MMRSAIKIKRSWNILIMLLCYRIRSKATNKAMVVIASAKELSTGITKLSGSKDLLKVNIEIA
jgi:hypothetical protein